MSNGRIPDDVFEAVLKHHDIVDTVGKYVHLSKQGHYMKGLCPFHSEKTPSFTVTPEKQIYHCFGCGAGGNVINFVMNIEGIPFGEAVRQLAEEAGIQTGWEPKSPEQTEQDKEKATLLEAYEWTTKVYHHILINTREGKPALDYLRNRGFTDKLIEQFQLGYAPATWETLASFLKKKQFMLPLMEKGGLLSARSNGDGYVDKFRDRAMFPIRNPRGAVIAFGGRALGDVQPKYMNSPETVLFNKGRTLFHFHEARPVVRKLREVVLFEGYVDLIKAWDAGVHNGVATMGTALTDEHAQLLRHNAETAIVCYDGDDAGQAAAFKSIPILEKAGIHVRIALLPNRLDPDEFIAAYGGERFVRDVLEGALPAVGFKLHYLRRNFNLQDVDSRLRYINSAVKLIAELPSPVDRDYYIKAIATEFTITPEAVRQQTNESRQELLKKQQIGDNYEQAWNNVRNGEKTGAKLTVKYPAHQQAERDLLAAMMADRDIANIVLEELGDQFHEEDYAALAAYLYAYYAQGHLPDASRFLASLQDERLEKTASGILMAADSRKLNNEQALSDCLQVVKRYGRQQAIDQMKEQLKQAERSGDPLAAAKILQEIITLEKKLKSS